MPPGVLPHRNRPGGRTAGLPEGRDGVAAGRGPCQRAARVLRDATALRVTRPPPRGSDGIYGPCGPAWTGRPDRPRRLAGRSGRPGFGRVPRTGAAVLRLELASTTEYPGGSIYAVSSGVSFRCRPQRVSFECRLRGGTGRISSARRRTDREGPTAQRRRAPTSVPLRRNPCSTSPECVFHFTEICNWAGLPSSGRRSGPSAAGCGADLRLDASRQLRCPQRRWPTHLLYAPFLDVHHLSCPATAVVEQIDPCQRVRCPYQVVLCSGPPPPVSLSRRRRAQCCSPPGSVPGRC